MQYARADYSVVVKNRAPPPKAWRWEIYRAGNANALKRSSIYFETTAAAKRREGCPQGAVEQALHLTNKAWNASSASASTRLTTPAARRIGSR
jgi:hypothetical protein